MQTADTMRTQTPKYVRPHTSIIAKKCSNSFFAISSQHVTVMNTYSTIDATICMVSNCWLSLYLNIAGLQQSAGKIASGVLEKSRIFSFNQ